MKIKQGNTMKMKRFLLSAGALVFAAGLASIPAAAQGQANPPAAETAPGDPQGIPSGAAQGAPQGDPQGASAAPASLTLSAGTVITVRTTGWLSSDKNHPGDRFSATLEQPLIANGYVVARRGEIVTGRVAMAEKAGHGKPASQLGLELSELTLVDGQVLPVSTQLVQDAGVQRRTSNTGRDVATVGATTVIGAVIGGVIGRGEGAAIGAGLGATAGVIGVMSTRGGPTVVNPETQLTFRLQAPLAVSTEQGQVAFQPVGQGDYAQPAARPDQDAYGRAPRRYVVAGPGYYPGYYYSPYGYGWGYPAPLYLGFGAFYGPRGGFRGGFRR